MPPGQLDRCLVALGAGITKEGLVGTGVFTEPCSEFGLLRRVVQIGNVVEFRHLRGDGFGEFGIGVSKRASGNAGHKVC